MRDVAMGVWQERCRLLRLVARMAKTSSLDGSPAEIFFATGYQPSQAQYAKSTRGISQRDCDQHDDTFSEFHVRADARHRLFAIMRFLASTSLLPYNGALGWRVCWSASALSRSLTVARRRLLRHKFVRWRNWPQDLRAERRWAPVLPAVPGAPSVCRLRTFPAFPSWRPR